jgi:hypothetical protein
MSIIKNPLLNDGNRRGLIPDIVAPAVNQPADQEQARTWQSLSSVVAALFAWLKLWEWHDETIPKLTVYTIPHGLGRKPAAFILVSPPSGVSTVSGDINTWTDRVIILSASGNGARVKFVLF